ncbi:MAG: cytochrome B [Hyphomicrobiaceae bacterium]|nr:cytochrome B [Hyphomicrobiaceae bacterium]
MAGGCAGPLSTLDPAGPASGRIATLWWVMLSGSVVIFAFVMVLLVMAWRRAPPDGGDESRALERLWVHRLGIAFPVVVLAALLVYGLVIGEALLPRASDTTVVVRAEARQWAWTFGYADAPGRRTPGVLHIPARRPVDVEITTLDVVHSFWVPRLAGKLDAIPGHVNRLRLEADAPGRYAGVSAEFNGNGYGTHAFEVVAHDPAGWKAFIERGGE